MPATKKPPDVDWSVIDAKLPLGAEPDSAAKRDALFKQFDGNGNGSLSMTECEAELTRLLKSDTAVRGIPQDPAAEAAAAKAPAPAAEEATEDTAADSQSLKPPASLSASQPTSPKSAGTGSPASRHASPKASSSRLASEKPVSLLPGVGDLKRAVKRSFYAARELTGRRGKQASIKKREFHALLFYFRYYLELLVLFHGLDEDEDMQLSPEECLRAAPLLESWNITKPQIVAHFKAKKVKELSFENFADWCLREKFEEEEFEMLLDKDDHPASPKGEAGVVFAGADPADNAATASDVLAAPYGKVAPSSAQSPQHGDDDGFARSQSLPNMMAQSKFNSSSRTAFERTRSPPAYPKMCDKARSTYRENQAKYKEYSRGHGEGVLERRAYQDSIAGLKSSPKYSIAIKTGSSYIRVTDGPSPGTYTLPGFGEKGRGSSFGTSNRFKYGEPPWRRKPGPGDHDPVMVDKPLNRRVGFGGAPRCGAGISADGPGPGAYELKPFGSDGIKYSAQGLTAQSYRGVEASASPCTYSPDISKTHFKSAVKVGFGTSTRGTMLMGEPNPGPGPGMYELQKYGNIGANAKAYSIISRRRDYQISDGCQPGPGGYNTDYTSFVGRH